MQNETTQYKSDFENRQTLLEDAETTTAEPTFWKKTVHSSLQCSLNALRGADITAVIWFIVNAKLSRRSQRNIYELFWRRVHFPNSIGDDITGLSIIQANFPSTRKA